MDDSWFGKIKDATAHVEVPVYETLRSWAPTYLQEKERQMSAERGLLPPFRSYHAEPEFDKFPEDQLPSCIIVSPGLIGEPERQGDGKWHAWYAVAIAAVTSAKDYTRTKQLAKVYASVVRSIMLQKGPGRPRWLDESFDDLVEEEGRQLAVGMQSFAVYVTDITDDSEGPPSPPDPVTQPGGDWPIVQTVIIDWTRKEDE